MNIPEPDFRHIVAMSDAHGLFEHAQFAVPRREHGYCTDDMARLLVVACREDEPDDDVQELARLAMRFLVAAQGPDGECHNRMDMNGQWTDDRSDEDCWGRSLWAFGTAAARSRDHALREEAAACFAVGAQVRSKWSHAMAFAALGAAEILKREPPRPRCTDVVERRRRGHRHQPGRPHVAVARTTARVRQRRVG